MKTLLHCSYVLHFTHEFIIIDQHQSLEIIFQRYREIRQQLQGPGVWIYFSLHTILFLVSHLSHCPLFSTQLFYQRPKQKDRFIECKKSRGKAKKEKLLGKDILFGKGIYEKGVKLERDQDMTPHNKPHWDQTYFELKTFEFPERFICLKAEPTKRDQLS